MLKNKLQVIILIMLVTLIFLTPFVSAVNETNASDVIRISEDSNIMPISEDPNQLVDSNTPNNEPTKNLGDTTNVSENTLETLKESDVYLFGDNIVIDYIVDGNLFVIADSVTINTHITGDAFICANNVTVNENGYIINNLFAVCSNLELKGVSYNVYAISENVNIPGYIYKDLRVSCKHLDISGVIHRNVFANIESIKFAESTEGNSSLNSIKGDFKYSSNQELDIRKDKILGNISYNKISTEKSFSIQDLLISIGKTITTCLLIWLLLIWLAPKFEKNTDIIFSKKILPILGIGLLVIIAIPIIILILLALGITSTIALLLLSIYFIIIAISFSLFAIAINNFICKKLNISKTIGIFGMLIATSAVIGLLTFVPYLGMIISLISILVGIGYFTTTILPKKDKTDIYATTNK